MVSKCRPKAEISTKEAAKILLEQPAVWEDLDDTHKTALRLLEEKQFVNVVWDQFVRCCDPNDALDIYDQPDPFCMTDLPIRPDFNEDSHSLVCYECNRTIFPITYQKHRFIETSVAINKASVIAYIESCMDEANLSYRKMVDGFYHVLTETEMVSVISDIPSYLYDP